MVMRLLRWLVFFGIIPLSGAAQPDLAVPLAPTTLRTVLTDVSAAGAASEPGSPARAVALPDAWSQSRPGAGGPVRYRASFALTSAANTGSPWAVRIERLCSAGEFRLNGALVYRGFGPDSESRGNCNQPVLVMLPAALLKTGPNVLELKLAGRPLERVVSRQREGGISAWEIAPAQQLFPAHERQRLLQSGVPLGLSLGLSIVGAFLLWMGRRAPRRDSFLVYFGALAVGLALMQLPAWMPAWPFDENVGEFLVASLWPFVTWAAVQFLLRYAGCRERIADFGLPIQAVVMPLSLLLAGSSNLQLASQLWAALLILQVVAAALRHLAAQWGSSPRGFWVMSLILTAVVLAELLGFYGVQVGAPVLATLGQALLPLLVLVVGMRLIQQRGGALESAEASRALLEQRVAEVKSEIEKNYRQLSELRVVQVTDRERKRIAADLHDDLGAKLLTIVHTSESERISTLAREALEEMRLSVRGLTGKPVRLEDALGDWRAEVISRLGQAGIEAVWNMPTEDLPHTLPARAFVQTTRIIREAVNNIIKHSGASQCAVRCNVADGDFQLVIQDNGKGIAMELDGRLDRGHGLSSMKGRAKQLQGQCLVESGPGYGTVIRLTIP